MAKKTTRVQLELQNASFERLQELKDKTEASSYAEVIKNALRLYESLIAETENGNVLSVQSPDGDNSNYKLIF